MKQNLFRQLHLCINPMHISLREICHENHQGMVMAPQLSHQHEASTHTCGLVALVELEVGPAGVVGTRWESQVNLV